MRRIYMGCVLLKEKVKINNMLPKNHEVASTSGEIKLRKDEDFDISCFEINCDGFLPTRVHLWPINFPCTPPPTPNSISDDDSGYECQ